MSPFYHYLNGLVNDNKQLYSAYPALKWINPYNAFELLEKRTHLLEAGSKDTLFKGTKPFYHHISKGCQRCGEGLWSCLFITGKCNASCFYCPTDQSKDDQPTSQQLTFDTPEAYAEYVNHFKFQGVSFSGGEPLLYFDRTLAYLKAVRMHCSPDIHIWMYTNGILADRDKMEQLAAAGLNEIRFDIGATAYRLDKVKLAQGIIDTITIEIPAVPEEKERLINLLPEMIEAGVSNLNLHQLRLTPFNVAKLATRDYTYLPAERPIVLESELTALELIEYARIHQLEIGINYCSFFFKYRFQKAGYRKRLAEVLCQPESRITEKGYLREIRNGEVCYKGLLLKDGKTTSPGSALLSLKHKQYGVEAGIAKAPYKFLGGEALAHQNLVDLEPVTIPEDGFLFENWQYEYLEQGLRE